MNKTNITPCQLTSVTQIFFFDRDYVKIVLIFMTQDNFHFNPTNFTFTVIRQKSGPGVHYNPQKNKIKMNILNGKWE